MTWRCASTCTPSIRRLDLETLGVDQPVRRPGVARMTWPGFVSAADADEGELVDLLIRVADLGCLAGAGVQGVGPMSDKVDPACVTRVAALSVAGPAEWRDVVVRAMTAVIDSGDHLGWWTRFDRGGSVADGENEWATAWAVAGWLSRPGGTNLRLGAIGAGRGAGGLAGGGEGVTLGRHGAGGGWSSARRRGAAVRRAPRPAAPPGWPHGREAR